MIIALPINVAKAAENFIELAIVAKHRCPSLNRFLGDVTLHDGHFGARFADLSSALCLLQHSGHEDMIETEVEAWRSFSVLNRNCNFKQDECVSIGPKFLRSLSYEALVAV